MNQINKLCKLDSKEMPSYVRQFLIYLDAIRGQSVATVREYFYDIRCFLRFLSIYFELVPDTMPFDEIPIADVSLEYVKKVDLDILYEYMSYVNRVLGNRANSRARKIASLRTFYKYLHTKARLIDDNPTLDLEAPKIAKTLPKYLDLENSTKLLETTHNERDFAILILLLNCGLRVSELIGINLRDIRGDKLTVIGKGNKERTVYLNEACRNALDQYLPVRKANGKDRDAVFTNFRDGGRLTRSGIHRIIKKYLAEAGLDMDKYSTHKLRHTAATLMYRYGNVDIRALQEILGHKHLSTTEIYTHLDDQQLRGAMDQNPLAHIKNKHQQKDDD